VFSPGDLVVVKEESAIKYFGGQTALIIANMGQDNTDRLHGYYYKVQFSDGSQHILTHRELYMLSKAERN
jgi:hypothetical protein|tara:strand:- start:70 stop:279 length:210 start_codon:yes stop_codon:yes gene_type:complete